MPPLSSLSRSVHRWVAPSGSRATRKEPGPGKRRSLRSGDVRPVEGHLGEVLRALNRIHTVCDKLRSGLAKRVGEPVTLKTLSLL